MAHSVDSRSIINHHHEVTMTGKAKYHSQTAQAGRRLDLRA